MLKLYFYFLGFYFLDKTWLVIIEIVEVDNEFFIVLFNLKKLCLRWQG